MITSGEGLVRAVSGVKEATASPGVHEISLTVNLGDRIGPLLSSDDYHGYVMAVGTSPSAAVRSVEDALKEISIVCD